MSIKYASMLQSFVFAVSLVFSIPIPAYANGLVTEGRDEFGRRTETIQLPNGGTEVHTYDRETGVERFSKTYHGSSGKDDLFPKVMSESRVNPETGERTVITHKDPFDHSKGRTERKYIDSRVLNQIRERERAEQDRLRYEWELEQIKKGQFITPITPKKREPDEWDFLPEYEPGKTLKDKESDADANSAPSEPAKDAMPLAEPEPLAPEPASEPQPDPAPDFSGFGSLGGFNEPEPKEIDYNKYGSFITYDHMAGEVAAHDPRAGTKTTFYPRNDVHFGDPRGGTVAVTTKDKKVIHEDYYDHLGNLVNSTSIDPQGGIKTITQFNPDGSVKEMKQLHPDGTPVINKASTTDPKTGQPTTSVGNPDGTHTVTVTDKDGNVISQQTTKDGIPISQETTGKKDSDVMIEGSATDPKTGITKTGKKLKDGTTEITITDKDGKVIGTEKRDASGKLISAAPPSAGDAFGDFDALSGSSMGQFLSGGTTPTAALDGSSARNMGADTGAIAMGSSDRPASDSHHYSDYSDL